MVPGFVVLATWIKEWENGGKEKEGGGNSGVTKDPLRWYGRHGMSWPDSVDKTCARVESVLGPAVHKSAVW